METAREQDTRSALVGALVPLGDDSTADVDDGSGGIFASPWFWGVIAGVVVVGAATALILIATSGGAPDPFQGTLMPGSITVD